MKCKLSEIAAVKGGKRLPKGVNLISTPNAHPYIRVRDLNGQRTLELNDEYGFVDEETQKKIARYIVKKGDIVLSIVGTIGLVSIVGESLDNANLTENCVKIIVSEAMDSKFLYYYLKSSVGQTEIMQRTVGAVQAKLPIKNIQDIDVWFPPKETQTQIASVLSCIDDKIEHNNKINANLQQQAQAIFKSWFVDFEPFGGTRPEDWNFICLEDCCSLITRGIAPKYDDTTDQIVLNQKCIRNQQIDLSKARKHRPKKVNEKWLQHGDILINSTGQGTLGRIAQVHFQPQNMTVDSHVTIVRPKHELLVYYLGCLLTGREYEFVEMERGSTGQTELPRESVQKYEVLLPDNAILKRFNDLMRPIFQLLVQNQEESLRLAEVRDALLPKLMSGEISLNEEMGS